ncbi:MAG: sulfotransferase [Rhizobacter sp.]
MSGGATVLSEVQQVLHDSGLQAALDHCQQHLRWHPEDADAHRHLSQLLATAGQPLHAQRAAMRACELAPDDARSWSDLGRVHSLAHQLDEALQCFTEAVEIDPRYADGWHNLGLALSRLQRQEPACTALRNALLIDDTRAATWVALGELLVHAGQLDDATHCFERAAAHDPTLALARSRLAEQCLEHGQVERAQALFRQSLVSDPKHLEGWLGLARTLEDLGEADEARQACRQALHLRPGNAHALGQYIALLRGRDDVDDGEAQHRLADARAALDHPATPDEGVARVGYGLAKFHDKRGEPAAAAHAARQANAARRRLHGVLDRSALAARVDTLIATCTREFFAQRRGFGLGADQPVFIVGLPRSGTTLTEQILSAHPQLHGAGELPALARLAVQVAGSTDEAAHAATRLDLGTSRATAGTYLHRLRNGAPKGRLRISDKSPLNFFHLGFAALLFPNARVVHCHRSLPDTALSIWMENFNEEQHYATDFGDLAFFAAQYQRLMAHWREVLPLQMLELRYEDMVADSDTQSRRLIDFAGVAWHERCLQFHTVERAVQTPSRWQVREPIYARSVGRWQAYAEHLPELVQAFGNPA